MSRFVKFFVVMIVILIGSVYLTPPIHHLLPMFKFEKIFNRLVMIFTIASAAVFVLLEQRKQGGTKLDREFWRKNGFDFSAPWKKLFLFGFVGGAVAVALISGWETAFGPRYLRIPLNAQDIVERFFKGATSGIIVGMVEEFFFRGFVFRIMRSKMNVFFAVILSSVFYAATHFLDNGQIFIPDNPSIGDAFRLLFGYLEPFVYQKSEIFPQFMGLFVFGILLCLAFVRTGSLFLSIGLHAGAVFFIKFQHSFIRKPLEDIIYPFFGRSPDYDGVFEWAVLAALTLIVWVFSRRQSA